MLVDHSLKTKKEYGDSRYIYQNEIGKACFKHDMVYGYFEGLARRITSDKILREKAFNIVKNTKQYGYQRGLTSMGYKYFDKKLLAAALKINISQNRN